MTWSDVAELMDKVASVCERDADDQRKLAAMHRQLGKDIRAMLTGKLMKL